MSEVCGHRNRSVVYDKVFHIAGSMGKAQFLIISVSFVIMVCGGWQQLLTVFAARDVDLFCMDSLSNGTVERSDVTVKNQCGHECSELGYDSKVSSIIKDFDLDCGRKKYLKKFVHSTYWLGYLASNIFVGYLSDRTGRKPTCVISITVQALSLIGTLFCPNIEAMLVIRFITGLSNGGCLSLAYLILVESSDEAYLSRIALLSQIFYCFGAIFAACSGYIFIFSWKIQFIVLAVIISSSILPSILFLPESPRWLYSKGKLDRAEKVLKWFAKLNDKDISLVNFKQHLLLDGVRMDNSIRKETTRDSESTTSRCDQPRALNTPGTDPCIFNLCETFRGGILFFSHLSLWSACAFIYFGLNFEAQEMGTNLYLCSIFLSVSELPTVFLYKIVDKVDHKSAVVYGLLLGTIGCFIIPFIDIFCGAHLKIGFAIFAKLMVTGSFNCLYFYTPETFPTVLRSTAVNSCFVAQNVAVTIAAILCETKFGPYNCGPFVTYGVLGIMSILSISVVGKETAGMTLLNTVEEYNRFVKA